MRCKKKAKSDRQTPYPPPFFPRAPLSFTRPGGHHGLQIGNRDGGDQPRIQDPRSASTTASPRVLLNNPTSPGGGGGGLTPPTRISSRDKMKFCKRKYGFGLFLLHNLLHFWVPAPPPPQRNTLASPSHAKPVPTQPLHPAKGPPDVVTEQYLRHWGSNQSPAATGRRPSSALVGLEPCSELHDGPGNRPRTWGRGRSGMY